MISFEFTIATNHGHREVIAEVYGAYAIHRCIANPGAWTVTHGASGRAVIQGITEQEARAIVQELESQVPAGDDIKKIGRIVQATCSQSQRGAAA